MDIDLSDLDQLAEQLGELEGVRSVTRDPSQLVTPGAWLQVQAFEVDTLSGLDVRVDVNFVLVVPDSDPLRAAGDLVRLLNVLRPALGNPPGPFTARTFASPEGTLLPALDLPVTLRITTTQE